MLTLRARSAPQEVEAAPHPSGAHRPFMASGASCSHSHSRCYARYIYPASTESRTWDADICKLMQALRVVYTHTAARCGGTDLLGIGKGDTKRECSPDQREKVVSDERIFPSLFRGCQRDVACESNWELRAARHLPPWAAQIRQGLHADNWMEVNRFALAGKSGSRKPNSWREYLDGGLSGWWYYRATGSGIFYRTGATRVATTKPAMVALLTREWAASNSLNTSRFLLDTLRNLSKAARSPATAAVHFQQRQEEARRPFHLSDAWDVLLIRLGRALGYETLIFTTEVDPVHRSVSSTLVDLRSPFVYEVFNKRVDLLERKLYDSPSLLVPTGARVLDEEHARKWVEYVATSGVLCLRDPFVSATIRPRANHALAPCAWRWRCNFTFELTVRLACPGHVSWSLREHGLPGCYKY